MKKIFLLKIALLPMLFITGCTSQPSTAAPTTATPTEQPAIPIPEVIQKDPINWGLPYSIDWSDYGTELAVEINNQINIYSNHDWRLTQTFQLEGLSAYLPFTYQNGRIIGFFPDDQPSIREYDPFSKQFSQTYPIAIEENLISINYEQMLYISQTSSCSFSIKNICTSIYSLHHIKDGAQTFNFYIRDTSTEEILPNFFFSQDGKYLVVSSGLNRLLVWNTQSEKLVFSTNVDSQILSVDFSLDDQLMLTACNDGTARVWNIETGTELSRIDHFSDGLYYAKFLKNDQEIIICTKGRDFSRWSFDGNTGKTVKISDLFSQEELGMEWGKNIFPEIELSSNEQSIAIISNNRVIIRSLTGNPEETSLPGYNGVNLQTTFSQDGEMMAVTDTDQIQIYGMRPYHLIATFPEMIQEAQLIHFVPNTNRLLAVTYDSLYDWNYETNQVISYKYSENNPCRSAILAISNDGSTYLSDGIGEINICSSFTHHLIKEIALTPQEYFSFYKISDDKSEVIASGSSRLVRWNLNSGEIISEISLPCISQISDGSFTGSYFTYYDNNNGMIKIIDISDGSLITEREMKEYVSSVIISPNKRLLAYDPYNRVVLLDSINGNILFSKDVDYLEDTIFNPVLDEFYTISYGAIVPWDYSNLADPVLYDQFATPTPEPLSVPCSSGEEAGTDVTETPMPQTPEPAVPQEDTSFSVTVPEGVFSSENILSLVVDQEIGKTAITYSSMSEDGTILAVSDYTEIILYDVKNHSILQTIPFSTGEDIYTISFNSDNSLLAFQLDTGDIEVWNLINNTLITSLTKGKCWGPALSFSKDNKTLSSVCSYFSELWDLDSGKLLQSQLLNPDTRISQDGSLSLEQDGNSIRVLNRQKEILKTIEYKNEFPARYYFSPDGQLVFISFVDVTAPTNSGEHPNSVGQIWDVSEPDNIQLQSSIDLNFSAVLYDPSPIYIEALFTRKNQNLILCLDNDQVGIYDTASGRLLSKIPGNSDCRLYKKNTQILTQDSAGNINIWDIKNIRSPRLIWQQNANNAFADGLQYGIGLEELIAYNNGMFYTSQLSEGQFTNKKTTYSIPRSDIATASPDGRWLAYLAGSEIYVLDREQGVGNWRSIYTPQSKSSPNYASLLVFSPDSQQMAASMPGQRIWVRNLIANTELMISTESYNNQLVFSPDGKTLLSVGYEGGRVWNTETGELMNSIADLGILTIFHPNGKIIFSIDQDESQVRVISYPSGAVIKNLSIPDSVHNAVLAPDGKTLALMNGSVTDFLNLETGEYLARMDDLVLYMDFSPDGKTMVTYLTGGRILTWKVGE